MSKANNLTDFLTDLANTIRGKDGTSATIDPQDFSTRIVNYQNKTVTPSTSQQSITRDSGYMALGTVTINAMPGGTATVQNRTSGGTPVGYNKEVSLSAGYYDAQVFYTQVNNVSGSIGLSNNTSGSATAGISNTDSMRTVASPSGTAGIDYFRVKATATGTAGSVTPRYTVNTAGYIGSTVTGSATSVSVSSDTTGQTINIPKATFTVDGNVVKTTSTGGGYIGDSTNAGTISGGTVSANSPTITPSISSTYTSGSGYAITGSATTSVSVGTAGYISSSIGTRNTGTASISGYVARSDIGNEEDISGSGQTTLGYGKQRTISAGYYPSARVIKNNVSAGTIDVTDLTITPNALSGTWDSTNNKYVVSQASKTATMQSTVTTAGYVSSTVGTKNTGTATVSAPTNLEIPKATFTVDGASVKTTSEGAGYIPASTTVGTVASGTSSIVGSLPQGATSTDAYYGSYVKIGAGYYSQDKYYKSTATTLTFPTTTESSAAQYYSSIASITPNTANQYINLPVGYNNSGKYYKINAVATGSATPSASYATLSSAGSSPTSVTSQYFKITPTASVGTAGWISSISNGTVQNYTVRSVSGSSGSNILSYSNCTLSTTNTSGISVSAISGGYTVSTAGWIGTGTYGNAATSAQYITDITLTSGKSLGATVNSGGSLNFSNAGTIGDSTTTVSSNTSNNTGNIYIPHKTSGSGNVYVAPYNSTTYNFYQIINNGELVECNLPKGTDITSTTSIGSSIPGAPIKPDNSNYLYINIPVGYVPSAQFYIIDAMPQVRIGTTTGRNVASSYRYLWCNINTSAVYSFKNQYLETGNYQKSGTVNINSNTFVGDCNTISYRNSVFFLGGAFSTSTTITLAISNSSSTYSGTYTYSYTPTTTCYGILFKIYRSSGTNYNITPIEVKVT